MSVASSSPDQGLGQDLAPPPPPDLTPPPPPDLAPCVAGAYPAAPYGTSVGNTLDSALSMQDVHGNALPLNNLYAPCAAQANLLILRLSTAWCGTCQWAVAHGNELVTAMAGHATLWEALATDDQNLPVTAAAMTQFAATLPAGGGIAVRHPTMSHALIPALGMTPTSGERLPIVMIIDLRSMKVRARLSDPDPDTLIGTAQQVLAVAEGKTPPPLPTPVLQDSRFTRDRWALIQAMALPQPLVPPPDPTNAIADDSSAVAFGRQLFLDPQIGGVASMTCTNCHQPMNYYQDARIVALGVTPAGMVIEGNRNTPWLSPAPYQRFQFWDGRADSQWMQALLPLENPIEFSSSRLYVVHHVLNSYAALYQPIFGTPPDLSDLSRFPATGMPGVPAWDNMAAADKVTVNRVFTNIGKAMQAFERARTYTTTMPLDSYVGGTTYALNASQRDGLLAFFDLGCAQCHYGPMLTDGAFHAMGFATGRADKQPDPGRSDTVAGLLSSEFNGAGIYSDAPAVGAAKLATVIVDPIMAGQFKTPSLRGAHDTAPYGHGGTYPDLATVLAILGTGGEPASGAPTMPARDPAMVQYNPSDPRLVNVADFVGTFRGFVPTF